MITKVMDESQMGGQIADNDTVFADKLAHDLQKLGLLYSNNRFNTPKRL
jgi:hypothetical protein